MKLFDLGNEMIKWMSENDVDEETIEDACVILHRLVCEVHDDYMMTLRRNADE